VKKHKKKEVNGVAAAGNKLTFNGNDVTFKSVELHLENTNPYELKPSTG